ncbi:alpha/beta fold hydrolase [Erythrobacter sp. Alg231-14]|uniref:alpha/beta fold hydrolase n=1 Tax=Erythrobacter sp. Alg231-14 TaxID=1922225 RepID=UPI000D55D42D
MTKRETLLDQSKAALGETELARRIALASEDYPDDERGKPDLLRFMGELDLLLEPARRPFRRIKIPKTQRPQTIIVMPGFATGPNRMRYMAQKLEQAGHRTKRWGLGRNWGVAEASMERLEERLGDVCARYDDQAALLGWSLGGLYARELAKRHPERISKVITMGSPFSGSPRANNVWRAYQAIAGHRVDQPPIEVDVAVKPPVETVALWSPVDGCIAPRSAAGQAGERDRSVALRCTHAGFTYTRESILAVLAELERV